jgi:hypothetical protein
MSSIFSTSHIEESLQASVDTVMNSLLKHFILSDTVILGLTVTGNTFNSVPLPVSENVKVHNKFHARLICECSNKDMQ